MQGKLKLSQDEDDAGTCRLICFFSVMLSQMRSKWGRNVTETAKSVKSLGLKDNTTNQIRMKIY